LQLALHKVSTASILKTLPAPPTKTDDFEGATLLQTHFEWMLKHDRVMPHPSSSSSSSS
jgi:hypothetical protein